MRSAGRRLVWTLAMVAALAGLSGPPAPATAGRGEEPAIRYTIDEARAYSYRVSLRKEVIEAARSAEPCDPETDPYGCDTTRYNHEPNCPPPLAIGASGPAPEARTVPGAEPIEGGAGAGEGAGSEPVLASAITLNELPALGRLGRSGKLVEAAGLASDSYVDLSGRQEPEMHTESDILPGVANVEERCLAEDETHESYRHFLSRSSEAEPATYHLSECANDECVFDQLMFSAEAVQARSVVDLREQGGTVIGRLQATFHDAAWGGGAFTVDTLDTAVTFESDGTPEGLRWSVTTAVAGAELGGGRVTLPAGQVLGNEQLQVGIAAPFVEAPSDGSALRIVAPGLAVASPEQTVYFAGAEVAATFAPHTVTSPGGIGGGGEGAGGSTASTGTAGTGASGTTTATSAAAPPAPTASGGGGDAASGAPPDPAPVAAAAPQERISLTRFNTGTLGFLSILIGGLVAAVWILLRWAGQFAWGRELSRLPPFSMLDRFYRAFVKS